MVILQIKIEIQKSTRACKSFGGFYEVEGQIGQEERYCVHSGTQPVGQVWSSSIVLIAVYVHCITYNLNLVVNDSIKYIPEIHTVFVY